MCQAPDTCNERPLNFESMLTDPLIRLVMQSDGVSMREMVAVLTTARDVLVQRELRAYRLAAD